LKTGKKGKRGGEGESQTVSLREIERTSERKKSREWLGIPTRLEIPFSWGEKKPGKKSGSFDY